MNADMKMQLVMGSAGLGSHADGKKQLSTMSARLAFAQPLEFFAAQS